MIILPHFRSTNEAQKRTISSTTDSFLCNPKVPWQRRAKLSGPSCHAAEKSRLISSYLLLRDKLAVANIVKTKICNKQFCHFFPHPGIFFKRDGTTRIWQSKRYTPHTLLLRDNLLHKFHKRTTECSALCLHKCWTILTFHDPYLVKSFMRLIFAQCGLSLSKRAYKLARQTTGTWRPKANINMRNRSTFATCTGKGSGRKRKKQKKLRWP